MHLRNPLIAKALDGFNRSDTVQELNSNERTITTREKSRQEGKIEPIAAGENRKPFLCAMPSHL